MKADNTNTRFIQSDYISQNVHLFQFASTAKKMKNDPHVTEVSDDGALLKRYRNEIVDLKRRLHEASVSTRSSSANVVRPDSLRVSADLFVTSCRFLQSHRPQRRRRRFSPSCSKKRISFRENNRTGSET